MDLPARSVTIHRLTLLAWSPASGRLDLEVHCSAGTYIRSLARDLGEALGCGGCLAQLRRTQALGFHDHQAVALPEPDDAPPTPLSPLQALAHLPRRDLTDSELTDWRCGRRLPMPDGPEESIVVCDAAGEIVGIGLREPGEQLRPKVVFGAAG